MAACRLSALLLVCLAAFSYGQNSNDLICDDELNSIHLTQAIDAAITALAGQQGWMFNLKSTNGYSHALDIFSCTPDEDRWSFPRASQATGLLKRVLDREEIVVAGVQWSQPGAADYATDPLNPTGFWPNYLEAIVDKLSEAYGKEITLTRKYYDNSVLVIDAVQRAEEVDMSEPYYYLGGFADNEPRIEAMGFSCVTAGTASAFFVTRDSGMVGMDGLVDTIVNGGGNLIGFIGQGNYDSVSSALPESVTPVFYENATEIVDGVKTGKLVAGYLSEGNSMGDEFTVFQSGIISPRAVLFRRELPQCPEDFGAVAAGAAASEGSSTGFELIIIIVLAAVALVLTVLLSVVVFKERQGSPIFTKL